MIITTHMHTSINHLVHANPVHVLVLTNTLAVVSFIMYLASFLTQSNLKSSAKTNAFRGQSNIYHFATHVTHFTSAGVPNANGSDKTLTVPVKKKERMRLDIYLCT